jgi:Skp family chaperone for outer membrane proteins
MDVKTFQRAILIVSIVWLTSASTWAQGFQAALLDVGYIFKHHPGFKQQMEAMKAEVQSFEQTLKQKQGKIQAAAKQISSFKPGSVEYKQLEVTTTKQIADLKVQMQLKRKEVMGNEAKIYMSTYKQVMTAVTAFATAKNIDLVLRYDRESDLSDEVGPQETLKIINRPVIFEKGLDISDAILQQLGGVAQRTTPQQPRRQ